MTNDDPATLRPTAVRWRILAWIVIASVVAYVLRFNLSVAGPAMMRDLGLSEAQLGLILGAFAWSYGLLQVPGGIFGERLGPRRAMTLLFIAWFAATALMALVAHGWPVALSVAVLVALRAAQGAVQAPLFPIACGGSLFAWLPPKTWALANGLTTAGTTTGAALAGPAVTWLVITLGWRQSFLVSAPLALVLAGLWWWDYRDAPAMHRGVNGAELALITDRAAVAEAGRIEWARLLTDRDLVCVTLSYFCTNYVFYLFFNWFFYYLTEVRHVPPTLAGYFVGAQWIVGSVTAIAGGVACDRLSSRFGPRIGCRVTAMGALALCAPLLVVGTLTADPFWTVALLSLSFGSLQFSDGSYWAATMRIAGPQSPSATGLLNTGGNVVGGVGAMLVPVIAGSFGWTAAVASGGAFALAAALLWLGVRPDLALQDRAQA
jgi:ACS family glucarate transporter-like MFS transporter